MNITLKSDITGYFEFTRFRWNPILIHSEVNYLGIKIPELSVPYEGGEAKIYGIIPIEEIDTDLYKCVIDHVKFKNI